MLYPQCLKWYQAHTQEICSKGICWMNSGWLLRSEFTWVPKEYSFSFNLLIKLCFQIQWEIWWETYISSETMPFFFFNLKNKDQRIHLREHGRRFFSLIKKPDLFQSIGKFINNIRFYWLSFPKDFPPTIGTDSAAAVVVQPCFGFPCTPVILQYQGDPTHHLLESCRYESWGPEIRSSMAPTQTTSSSENHDLIPHKRMNSLRASNTCGSSSPSHYPDDGLARTRCSTNTR